MVMFHSYVKLSEGTSENGPNKSMTSDDSSQALISLLEKEDRSEERHSFGSFYDILFSRHLGNMVYIYTYIYIYV